MYCVLETLEYTDDGEGVAHDVFKYKITVANNCSSNE